MVPRHFRVLSTAHEIVPDNFHAFPSSLRVARNEPLRTAENRASATVCGSYAYSPHRNIEASSLLDLMRIEASGCAIASRFIRSLKENGHCYSTRTSGHKRPRWLFRSRFDLSPADCYAHRLSDNNLTKGNINDSISTTTRAYIRLR